MRSDHTTQGFIQSGLETFIHNHPVQSATLLDCLCGENVSLYTQSESFLFHLCLWSLIFPPHTTEEPDSLA